MWQAWQARAKPSSVGLLSDDTIDPVVQAHMTLAPKVEEDKRFSFVLEECRLSDDEWERHCMENIGGCGNSNNSGLALVPLRRSSHT